MELSEQIKVASLIIPRQGVMQNLGKKSTSECKDETQVSTKKKNKKN